MVFMIRFFKNVKFEHHTVDSNVTYWQGRSGGQWLNQTPTLSSTVCASLTDTQEKRSICALYVR